MNVSTSKKVNADEYAAPGPTCSTSSSSINRLLLLHRRHICPTFAEASMHEVDDMKHAVPAAAQAA